MMDWAPGGRIVFRYWPVIAAVAVTSAIVAFAVSFVLPPSYSAATQVLVRAKDIRFLTSTAQDPNTHPGIDLTQPKSVSQTLGGIATSKAVAAQVVRDLGLDQPKADTSTGLGASIKHAIRALPAVLQYGYYAEPDPFDAAVTLVQRSIEATPIKDSYLIEIRARAGSPELAASIANSATQAFIANTTDSMQQDATSYRTFLESELDRAQGEVSKAEDALASYKQQHGITDAAEAAKLAAGSAETLRQQIRDVDTELANDKAQRTALQSSLSSLSPTERTTSSTQSPGGASQESVSPNRVYQDVQRSIFTLDGDIGGLQAKRDALATALTSTSANADQLAQDTSQLSQLDLQRTAAHNTYTSIRTAYESALMNEAQGAQEVSQIDKAVAPVYPDRPVRSLFLILGLFFGLGVGVVAAYLLDQRRERWVVLTSSSAPSRSPGTQPAPVTPISRMPSGDASRAAAEPRRAASRYEL